PSTAPTIVSVSVMLSVPSLASYLGLLIRPLVSVQVPAGNMMVSALAGGALASTMASRKLHLPTVWLAHALGFNSSVGSSTVNVGSGIGINIEGAISPWCKARIPGRLSTLMRNGNAATGEPL